MKLHKIRITAGGFEGRYVGARFGGGYLSNPDEQKNPPVNVPGSMYGLWAQEDAATQFFEGKAQPVQVALKKLGYESELVEVG